MNMEWWAWCLGTPHTLTQGKNPPGCLLLWESTTMLFSENHKFQAGTRRPLEMKL